MSSSSGSRPSGPGSLASAPAELIRLVSAAGSRHELEIERRSDNSLKIVEIVYHSPTNIERTIRRVDLQSDAVLLLYAISQASADPARKFNVAIVYGKGLDRETVEYPLLNELEAFRFQRLIASYTPYKRFAHVGASALSQRRIRRAVALDILGELQLWCLPRARHTAPPVLTHTATGDSGGARGGGAASVVSQAQTLRGAVVQTNYRGEEIAVTAAEAPPLLMAFEELEGEYKMMRVDVTGLNYQCSAIDSTCMDLIAQPGKSFSVDTLSVTKLEDWNLCDVRPRTHSKKFTRHDCTYLTLYFDTRNDLELFVKSLRLVQAYALGVALPLRRTRTGSSGGAGSRSSMGSLPDIPDVGEFFQQLLNDINSSDGRFGRGAQGDDAGSPQTAMMTPAIQNPPPPQSRRQPPTSPPPDLASVSEYDDDDGVRDDPPTPRVRPASRQPLPQRQSVVAIPPTRGFMSCIADDDGSSLASFDVGGEKDRADVISSRTLDWNASSLRHSMSTHRSGRTDSHEGHKKRWRKLFG